MIGSVHDVYRGHVEILFNGVWGRICSTEDWTITESNVVCRQLGFDGAMLQSYNGEGFNVETGVIGFSYVECAGNENSILNCTSRFRQWDVVGSCQYNDNAGVMCNPPGKKMTGYLHVIYYLFIYLSLNVG